MESVGGGAGQGGGLGRHGKQGGGQVRQTSWGGREVLTVGLRGLRWRSSLGRPPYRQAPHPRLMRLRKGSSKGRPPRQAP